MDLSVAIRTSNLGIGIRQEIDRSPHQATLAEERHRERNEWFRAPKWDERPSERLTIYIVHGSEYARSSWTDGPRTRLEACLPAIARELETRAVIAEYDELARADAAAKRRSQWEAAVERATNDLRHSNRAAALADQADRWHRAKALRDYVDALKGQLEDTPSSDPASEWIAWAEHHIEAIDPLRHPIAAPPDPDPTPNALQPFLRGWTHTDQTSKRRAAASPP